MDDGSDVAPITGARLELLKSLGYADLVHDSHVPFLSHLIGTRRLLAAWGCAPALCDGGLFHSVYGTEFFEPERVASRDEVRAVIGDGAERIAWLWCNIERDTLDPTGRSVRLRGGAIEALTGSEGHDVATLWAADTVEQIARMEPHERGCADGLRTVLPLACAAARQAVDDLGSVVP